MLLLLFIWVSVLSAINAKEVTNNTVSDLSTRIFYGTEADITDYPFFASLSKCGAAIISDRWLVTAAHCVARRGLVDYQVWVGGNDFKTSQRYDFDNVVIHPEYFVSTVLPGVEVNDIALVRLKRPLKFGNTVKAVTLPRKEYELNAVHNFAGRGLDEKLNHPKHLMKVDLHTVGTDECMSHLRMPKVVQNIFRSHLIQIKQIVFCAQRIPVRAGLCYGDSGSPLVRNNTLVGLASFIPNRDCSVCRVGFFTNVAHFVSWIKIVTGIK